ncbi:MAG: YfiR family protein [Candidatus Kapabacteria bacterium]|nr:YfiR family protein [Candidatus Kapabacteria bacterium]
MMYLFLRKISVILFSFLLFINSEVKSSDIADEYELKAAFFEKFARFIEWPEEANAATDPFEIVVLGDNPFGRKLENLYSKQKIKNRTVKIRLVKSVEKIGNCQILFICPSMSSNLQTILKEISNKNILTIGQSAGFCEKGVHINFYLSSSKLKFQINEKAAKNANFKISHLLLQNGSLVNSKGDE